MDDSAVYTLFEGLDRQGPGSDPSTRRMFDLLSPPPHARILDIGCGAGSQTLALARHCRGCHLTAVDIHRPYLDSLSVRALDEGLLDRIALVRASMEELPFLPGSFDLIWSEGSIFVIGFSRGLSCWKRFLSAGGGMAITELVWFSDRPPREVAAFMQEAYPPMTTVRGCEQAIREAGYRILGSFPLPEEAWWEGYYDPFLRKSAREEEDYHDPRSRAILDSMYTEIDLFRRYSRHYGYQAFLIVKA